MNRLRMALLLSGLVVAGCLGAQEGESPALASPSPEGARLYFITPVDGAVVATTFTVRFGLAGMGVAPAGVDAANTGHHHLLIDYDGEPPLNQPLPATDKIRHFGGGQTETQLTLPTGKHRLRLMLGNYLHIPYDPPVASDEITITVSE